MSHADWKAERAYADRMRARALDRFRLYVGDDEETRKRLARHAEHWTDVVRQLDIKQQTEVLR